MQHTCHGAHNFRSSLDSSEVHKLSVDVNGGRHSISPLLINQTTHMLHTKKCHLKPMTGTQKGKGEATDATLISPPVSMLENL